MAKLRVALSDLESIPVGARNISKAEVSVAYSRDVALTSGVILSSHPVRKVVPATGFAEWDVTPSDATTVPTAQRGFGLVVTWLIEYKGQRGVMSQRSGTRTVVLKTADGDRSLGLLADAVPTGPAYGSPVLSVNGTAPDASGNVTVAGGGGGSAPDATTTAKGIVQLAGDLGGTAAAPTVPGLAGKANTSHTHSTAQVTGLDTALAGKASSSHTHPASQVSDSTTVGRSVLTAADAAAARTAIGAQVSGAIGGVTVTGIPTAGQVPTATSGTAATWQTPATGGGSAPPRFPLATVRGGIGMDTLGPSAATPVSGAPIGAGASPSGEFVTIPIARAYTRYGINCTTAGAAGALVRFALYPVNAAGRPDGAPAWVSATIDVATTGVKTVVATGTIPAGDWLFLAFANTEAGAARFNGLKMAMAPSGERNTPFSTYDRGARWVPSMAWADPLPSAAGNLVADGYLAGFLRVEIGGA